MSKKKPSYEDNTKHRKRLTAFSYVFGYISNSDFILKILIQNEYYWKHTWFYKNWNDIHRTTIVCLSTDEVMLKVSAFPITNPSLFQNENLQIKLIVKNQNYYVDWTLMKKSTINQAGFGLFALRDFEVDETISVYLGEEV